MASLFGGSRVNNKTPPATSLRIQTSLNGQPVPVIHGRNRIAGNLIWYAGFGYTGASGKGGGKGGGGGGKGQAQQANYYADIIVGIAEGPLCYWGTIWSGQTIQTIGQQHDPGYQGFSSFDGTQGPEPWSWLETAYPAAAIGYSSLGYVGYNPIQLGQSPALPNLTYEIGGSVGPAVSETLTIPASGSPVLTPSYWNLSNAVTEPATIPATAPYQIVAQNAWAKTSALVAANPQQIAGSQLPGSGSAGVIDINGRVFTRVSGTPTASGTYSVVAHSASQTATYTFAAADAGLDITIIDFAQSPGVSFASTGEQLTQVLASPGEGEFSVSVQSGSYGQYTFASADAGKPVIITDVPDADPAASLADFLTNPRYGCGFPSANLGPLTTLQNYAIANGLFISPALVASQAMNSYLNDFATGLNGEFVWSGGLLDFVPYGDAEVTGYGKTYAPPSAVTRYGSLDDDDFLKNEGTASVGVSAFTSDDPVICVRSRPSDADNDVKVEYLDRGNSYNPSIAEAQDDAAINLYGLRPADTKQLHMFCFEQPAMLSAQLQLSRQQMRNLYTFTVPWYFILLDPMDIISITDAALGLDATWVRIREITENQEDGTLTITAEEYLQGTGSVTSNFANQPRGGYTPNLAAPAVSVN